MPTKTKRKPQKTKSKKAVAKKTAVAKKKAKVSRAKKQVSRAKKQVSRPKKQVRKKSRVGEPEGFSVRRPEARSGRMSGDLQGLSQSEDADSESVAGLVEEGNPFEADIVAGVEAADADEGEVRTHQVREDDVPEEYLDKD
jgi:hypothetical protein